MTRERVLLLGASPYGMRALHRTGVPFMLVHDRHDDLNGDPNAGHRNASSVVSVDSIADADAVDDILSRELTGPSPPMAVLSFAERGQTSAAELSSRHGFAATPGMTAVGRITNKLSMRETLAGTPLDWPYIAGDVAEIHSRLHTTVSTTAPWIVKPLTGSGSAGVALIAARSELDAWASRADDGGWIAERAARGAEYSVEAVTFAAGDHQILGITEKHVDPRSFVESGHCFPARLPGTAARAIAAFVREVLSRLELELGASHTELKYSPEDGIMLIETHTRPGGDEIPELVRRVTGLDQYELAIRALLGRERAAPPPRPSAEEAAIVFIMPPRAGRLESFAWPKVDGTTTVRRTKQIGAQISRLRSSEDRLGWVLATHNHPPAGGAWEKAARIAAEVSAQVVVAAQTGERT